MSLPEPRVDPAPDEFPGGADAVDDYVEEFPHLTPDPPFSAQIEDEVVPNAVRAPDDKQQEGDSSDGHGADPTSEPA
ncbi:hypothetical protein [Nocardioides terrisoli]|uniref:hypothetical protein n=1 Tax=Nocardioides terrisoli TaxID=3388267 RepID=UPI00287BA439|nr:hypothetical protein [Nocardioides marmorisolisilvae]